MPNHCSNKLGVYGDPAKLSEFVATVTCTAAEQEESKEMYSIFEKTFPCPAELRNVDADTTKRPAMLKKYGASNWYEWCIDNWGTKWGDYHTVMEDFEPGEDGEVFFTYTTAWGPATQGLLNISKLYPDLLFVNLFEESGMEIMGGTVHKNGIELDRTERTYPAFTDADNTHDDSYELYQDKVVEEMESMGIELYQTIVANVSRQEPAPIRN